MGRLKGIKYDLNVHIRNPKSGVVERVNPYRRHVDAGRTVIYERDGEFRYENNELVPHEMLPKHLQASLAQPEVGPEKPGRGRPPKRAEAQAG